jgi:hypothetical protein
MSSHSRGTNDYMNLFYDAKRMRHGVEGCFIIALNGAEGVDSVYGEYRFDNLLDAVCYFYSRYID